MKTYSFTPQGVCAKQITFAIDEQGKLHDVRFIGGCPGNLSAISKLLEGADPKNVAVLLKGNDWADLWPSLWPLLLFAAVVITVTPVLIVYVIFQRQLQGSVSQGTMK